MRERAEVAEEKGDDGEEEVEGDEEGGGAQATQVSMGPTLEPRWCHVGLRLPRVHLRWRLDGTKLRQDDAKLSQDGPKLDRDSAKSGRGGAKRQVAPRWR